MELNDIRRIITTTERADWLKTTCWGGAGPSFLSVLDVWGSKDGQTLVTDSHANVAVYRGDVALTIAWGLSRNMEMDGFPNSKQNFGWNEDLPDTSASVHWADVFWCGALIERYAYVTADGGRAYLPLTDHERRAGSREGAFIRLVNSFEHRESSFDEYMARTGITLSPEQDDED